MSVLTSKPVQDVPADMLTALLDQAYGKLSNDPMTIDAGLVSALCRDLEVARSGVDIANRLTELYRDERDKLVDKNEDLQRRVAAANTAVAAWDDVIRQCRADKAELEALRGLTVRQADVLEAVRQLAQGWNAKINSGIPQDDAWLALSMAAVELNHVLVGEA
ncbi:hypothetical protein [Deinococcus ruber]|uniref:Uncharacterized protein n=1 Tax=Deinococcus ruber TaxID=1848197 RepID=A0A918C1M9_9DEIO|nr:hypothetical protein [Deinococcus ruber]GGR00147.1 hypothetical protein GCM10008957_11090 [Deinococcus ruber]